MKILGIWDGHDSGAARIVDGRLVAAVNEERFSRRKLEVCFPDQSIATCLRLADVGPEEIDLVAASTSDVAKAIARIAPSTKEMYYQVRRRKAEPGMLTTLCRRGEVPHSRAWAQLPVTTNRPPLSSQCVECRGPGSCAVAD